MVRNGSVGDSMGVHDRYGKEIMRLACGDNFASAGPCVIVRFGAHGAAYIDGVVGERIAVEIDSRTDKQVHGAVLDLICHDYPKKLLILIPEHIGGIKTTAEKCRYIMRRFVDPALFRVVTLRGTGHAPQHQIDAEIVKSALAELGYRPADSS